MKVKQLELLAEGTQVLVESVPDQMSIDNPPERKIIAVKDLKITPTVGGLDYQVSDNAFGAGQQASADWASILTKLGVDSNLASMLQKSLWLNGFHSPDDVMDGTKISTLSRSFDRVISSSVNEFRSAVINAARPEPEPEPKPETRKRTAKIKAVPESASE